MRADYFTVAVRTGGSGLEGISLLLVEKDLPGFSRTPLDKMGWHCADTATLYFEDVRVPVENLIGPQDGGFLRIVENFNGERLVAAHQCCAFARVCLQEAAGWASQRETFGKKLGQHPVIRSKLADMRQPLRDARRAPPGRPLDLDCRPLLVTMPPNRYGYVPYATVRIGDRVRGAERRTRCPRGRPTPVHSAGTTHAPVRVAVTSQIGRRERPAVIVEALREIPGLDAAACRPEALHEKRRGSTLNGIPVERQRLPLRDRDAVNLRRHGTSRRDGVRFGSSHRIAIESRHASMRFTWKRAQEKAV